MADQLSAQLASLKISRGENPNRKSPVRWVVALAAVAAVGAGGWSVGVPWLEARVFKTEVGFTEIASVSPAQASVELTSTGYVVPQVVSKVAVKVPGKVARVAVKQGDRVEAGALLFDLDVADHAAAVAAARSRVAAMRARVATAKADAETARATLGEARQRSAREAGLVAAGVSPKGAADDLAARVRSLEQAVAAAEAVAKAAHAEVRAAQAEVDALDVNRKNFAITAPIGGTILNKPPEVGEYVGPQPAGISVDMGGVELADFSTLQVETDVPEARLNLVKAGGPCEIVLDAFPSKRYRGKVTEITPRVNRAKATVTVKVKFVDAMEGVLPDMSARVSFLAGELDAASLKEPPKTVVPGSAIADRGGAKVVFLVEDGRARPVPVTLGPAFGGGFELVAGPPAGSRVIAEPPPTLADGQRVKERSE